MLVHHFVEDWLDSFLGKSWISHTDNGLEVGASENGGLFLDITEFLISNVNLSTASRTIASTNSDIIGHEMSRKGTRAELDHSSLRKFLGSRGCLIVVRVFLLSVSWEVNLRVEDPCVGGAGIEEGSELLWRVSNVYLGNVGVVLEVDLSNVSLDWLTRLVNWAVGDLINSRGDLGMLLRISAFFFVLAVGQLNICNIKRLWFTVLFGFAHYYPSVTLGLR
jgi:hypothetical protein